MEKLEYYLGLPYEVSVTPDKCTDGSDCYLARIVELPGCESHGDTPEEALANLEDAKNLFITSMIEDGVEPPVPVAISAGTYKGKTMIWEVVPSTPGPDLPRFIGGPTRLSGLGAS